MHQRCCARNFLRRGRRNYVTSEEILTFSRDVTAAIVGIQSNSEKSLCEFDPTTMQNLGNILPLFSGVSVTSISVLWLVMARPRESHSK